MEVLRVENVSKTYGSGENKVEALQNINLSVKRGELVAIMGPSGSGKSTLMHIMGGVERPTGGSIIIDGQDIYSLNKRERAIFRRRNIGIVYQFDSLIPALPISDNISLPAYLDRKTISDERIQEMLEILNLAEKKDAMPDALSGGQKQRVAIGRALINAPTVILADEPTGNLDSKNSQNVMELFKLSNRKYKQTIIIITHDEEIALQADRIIHIDDGRVVGREEIR